jgi:hypothetical protein
MTIPLWLRGGPAANPAANDDEVPEGVPGCRCTLPFVPSVYCRFHGEGLPSPAWLDEEPAI